LAVDNQRTNGDLVMELKVGTLLYRNAPIRLENAKIFSSDIAHRAPPRPAIGEPLVANGVEANADAA
jgi:hypothetical protein